MYSLMYRQNPTMLYSTFHVFVFVLNVSTNKRLSCVTVIGAKYVLTLNMGTIRAHRGIPIALRRFNQVRYIRGYAKMKFLMSRDRICN